MDIETLKSQHADHWMRAAAIRTLTLDAVAAAGSGHSGMPMGMADVATVLFSKHLKFDASAPDWWDRDRFILSAGHGSMLLYSLLYLTGYPGMTIDEIRNFRQLGAKTAGHPEYGHAPGIETTTGPLGQGFANAVGFAIAEESLRARFGRNVFNHHTYVIAGDGCLMEGISQEALTLAGSLRLGRLIVLFDDNGITIDGPVSLSDRTDQLRRFNASGWHVAQCDGHDPDAIDAAIRAARDSHRPSLVACKTHIALGSAAQDSSKGHGALTDPQLIADTRAAYGWTAAPFEIPAEIKAWWEDVGRRGAAEREAWEARFAELGPARRTMLERAFAREVPPKFRGAIRALKRDFAEGRPTVATRKASETVLDVLNPILTDTIGGSADLTGSNNTRAGEIEVFSTDNRKGRYIHYGVREHAMAAAMNGLSLHGGIRPYGGTFLVFSDYARGAMRLSALMKQPVTYVLTHDSIGLGEDGPTHQPVEHLAMLRATPNLNVIRPADAAETAEAWEIALTARETPTVLALSRQGLPNVRDEFTTQNATALGAYVLARNEGVLQAILIATGSEVQLALAARDVLQADGIGTRVVSMPCMELFAQQDELYRRRVLPGGSVVRIGIEAGTSFGWDRWLSGERGRENKAGFIGMDDFGASAPQDRLFEHFGITAEAIVQKVGELI